MEVLSSIAAGFTLLLVAYALSCCWRENTPRHHKIVYTIVILLLPLLGAVIYFKQREEMRRNAKPRRKRSL